MSKLKRINCMIKSMDMSYIHWRKLALLIFICILCIVMCFTPYPNSNGESILQHLIFGEI